MTEKTRNKALEFLEAIKIGVKVHNESKKYDLDEIVNQCNYSQSFINTANDLQILDAISECYESYKVISRNNKK